MPSRSPLSRIRHGRQKADARRYSSQQLAPGSSGPRAGCARRRPSSAIRARSPGPASSSGPDDHGLERDAAAVELAAGVDDDVEALLRHEAPDPEHAASVPLGPGAAAALSSPISREKSAFRPW